MCCIPSAAAKYARVMTTAVTCDAGVDVSATVPEAVVLQNLLNVVSRQTLPVAPVKSKPAKASGPDSTLIAPPHDTGVRRLAWCRCCVWLSLALVVILRAKR